MRKNKKYQKLSIEKICLYGKRMEVFSKTRKHFQGGTIISTSSSMKRDGDQLMIVNEECLSNAYVLTCKIRTKGGSSFFRLNVYD